MPEQATLKRARRDKRAGRAPSTQAGEFVREEIHHIREGKHGARSTKQAVAIGLRRRAARASNSPLHQRVPRQRRRRARIREPSGASAESAVIASLARDTEGLETRRPTIWLRQRLCSRQATMAARRRSAASRRASARKAVRTKGSRMRRAAARKAARTRSRD